MRLDRLTIRGLTRYEEAAVDFAALGPGLIAIAGPNGAGKTTLLEAPFAALHLELPTRPGALAGVCHGKSAGLDLSFSNGKPYRALVAVDAIARTTEAYLYREDGSPITDGKVRGFTAETEKRFGSPRLFLSACLSAQSKRGSFLDLSKAERKDLLAEILDTGGLQSLAEIAREKAKAAETQLLKVRAQVETYEGELATLGDQDLTSLEEKRDALTSDLRIAQISLENAREEYGRLRAQLDQAEAAQRDYRAKLKDRDELNARLSTLQTKRFALDEELVRLKNRIGLAQESAQGEAGRLQEYQEAEAQLSALQTAKNVAEVAVQSAEAELLSLRSKQQTAERAASEIQRVREKLTRAVQGAAILEDVPCRGDFPTCGFLKRAYEDRSLITALEDQEKALDPVASPLHAITSEMEAQASVLSAKRQALKESISRGDAISRIASKAPIARAASSRLAELERELLDGEGAILQREGELDRETRQTKESLVRMEATIGAPPATPDRLTADLLTCEAKGKALKLDVSRIQSDLTDAERAASVAKANLDRQVVLRDQLSKLRTSEGDHARDAGEWAVLERALGRDGVQALEIDAAGPELSSLTNELLSSCFGPRFEVRFVTQVPKADGKGSKEVFDVAVIDHDRGREGSVDSLSGGEKTIVSEAISLALAIYVGKHSGRRFETIFRDETAGALDPDNAARYVAMLRRARVMAGAHQVIFIAQQPEVWQSADAILWCEGGKVEVKS